MNEDTHFFYKRSRFKTKLPRNRQYLKSHFWIDREEDAEGGLKVGYTKFSVRMLGELVESDYEVKPGDKINLGEVIGWVEGFKATTDIYSVVNGEFLGGNPAVAKDPELFFKKPYEAGWLYRIKGDVDPESMSVEEYASFLDKTIDRLEGAEA